MARHAQFRLSPRLIESAIAALRSGKHLLLLGAPGTGKTTIAQLLARAATEIGIAAGSSTVTATADWTSVDTVGGYWLAAAGQLTFRSGQILRAIEENSWLTIDELNRADIDKAIGQMFTVLSGQSVTLPFIENRDGAELPVSIVPPSAQIPPRTHARRIPRDWRIIATLNTRDRDLLFSMSFALLRRFAVIEIPNPPANDYKELLASQAATGSKVLTSLVYYSAIVAVSYQQSAFSRIS